MTPKTAGPCWPPIATKAYDQGPLTAAEYEALACVLAARGGWTQHMSRTLGRLTQPIHDLVFCLEANTETARHTRNVVVRVLAHEMLQLTTVYWQWTAEQWAQSITLSAQDFALRYGKSVNLARKYVIICAYLFGDFADYAILRSIPRLPLAQAVFGQEAVARAIDQVCQQLRGLGYGVTAATIPTIVCDLLLLHRSPQLEGLPIALIEQVYQEQTSLLKPIVVQISRALAACGILPHSLTPAEWRQPPSRRRAVGSATGPAQLIEPFIWDQLIDAVITLNEQDLPHSGRRPVAIYPFALVHALAVALFFSGERAKEVVNLRVGCLHVRPVGDDDGLSLLEIHYRNSGPLRKAVPDRVVQALAAWEAVRPQQPASVGGKHGIAISYLFSYRGRPIQLPYFDSTLLPLLCHKAGIAASDCYGKITPLRVFKTSRARGYSSTRATESRVSEEQG